MRIAPLLLSTALIGCADVPCNDAPLAGNVVSCANLDGAWLVQASDFRKRCGAELFSNALELASDGTRLRGSVGGNPLLGAHYVSGAFELDSIDGRFSLTGHAGLQRPLELAGSVVFGGPGQSCDAMWDFTATRSR
ncbi:MAG: hypothetical protein QM817_13440 [Archangium sp.]